MSYLERWWRDASEDKRESFTNLVKNGQSEIVGGGWVMNDEVCSQAFIIPEIHACGVGTLFNIVFFSHYSFILSFLFFLVSLALYLELNFNIAISDHEVLILA